MCVLAMSWNAHPDWRLVVAGNRDESHARPAAPLGPWRDDPEILGGRDEVSGGGWLGVAPHRGRFAVITNLAGHGPADPAAPSRGGLVQAALGDGLPALDTDVHRLTRFNPFSLISIDQGRAWFTTNRPNGSHRELPPGDYTLSNGPLDAPWDKTIRLKAALALWLGDTAPDPCALLAALDDRRTHGDRPWTEPATSPLFVSNSRYGTRCSTVVAIDRAGQGQILERRFDPVGAVVGEVRLPFVWLA